MENKYLGIWDIEQSLALSELQTTAQCGFLYLSPRGIPQDLVQAANADARNNFDFFWKQNKRIFNESCF